MNLFSSTTLFLASVGIFVAAAPATIAAAHQQDTPATEKSQEKSERRVCRRVSASTGSRLEGSSRLCLTAEQWRQRSMPSPELRQDRENN